MSDPARAPSDEYSLAPPDPSLVKSSQLIEPEPMPVPETSHLSCANCGYSLTGLTSRRCPECGTSFSLYTGRNVVRTGRERAEDNHAIFMADAKTLVGGLALVFALAAPWVAASNRAAFVLACVVTWVNVLLLAFGLKYLIASNMTLANWIFRMGLLLAPVGAIGLWLMW